MKKLLSKFFYKLGALNFKLYSLFKKTGDKITPDKPGISALNKLEWYRINGDQTLRVEYDMNENSVVFDVGGYEGEWASEISARYTPTIYIFEPVSIYIDKLNKRFHKNNKIKTLPYGLAGENKEISFSILDQSSSAFKAEESYKTRDAGKEKVSLRSFSEVCKELGTKQIDLIKINIEGGEYELLDHIIQTGWIKKIKNIQVQFHDFVPDADKTMIRLKKSLSLTHSLTYEYLYVWENWKLKAE